MIPVAAILLVWMFYQAPNFITGITCYIIMTIVLLICENDGTQG